MRIEVRLFATLRRYLPPGSKGMSARIDVEEGLTVSDLMARLGIPQDRDPESGTTYLIIVNGEQHDAQVTLHDGDCVSLYPPLAGGTCRDNS
ncbi:MAG: MoaD/ThiS family protein [Candidatus Latescibacteria bacterium]|nr:MoaD/ThiS family protein [Candidatus Latescibacterota bacterium]